MALPPSFGYPRDGPSSDSVLRARAQHGHAGTLGVARVCLRSSRCEGWTRVGVAWRRTNGASARYVREPGWTRKVRSRHDGNDEIARDIACVSNASVRCGMLDYVARMHNGLDDYWYVTGSKAAARHGVLRARTSANRSNRAPRAVTALTALASTAFARMQALLVAHHGAPPHRRCSRT